MHFPQIDPVFLRIGPLQFRWYGLMYVLAFVATYLILRSETRRKQLPLTADDVADLVFYGALGVVLGGRLGYILFYKLPFYLAHPLQIFAVWEGGMSFHGGFLGVIIAFVIYARRKRIPFFTLIDMAALCAPVGLGLGRIGNFINGELSCNRNFRHAPQNLALFVNRPQFLENLQRFLLAPIPILATRSHAGGTAVRAGTFADEFEGAPHQFIMHLE